jgi:hypothetical protein
MGPAAALLEPAGALAEELAAIVGAFVGSSLPSGSVADGDGDGDGSSVNDGLGVADGAEDWTGADDDDDGEARRRGLAASGLQVDDGEALAGPDSSVLWLWLSVLPGPPPAWPPAPELPPDEPAEFELLGKIACCASKAT